MARKQQVALPDFDVSRTCFKCASESISNEWHEKPVRIVGQAPRTACDEFFPDRIGEHVCRSCRDCGFAWCEAAMEPGRPDYSPRHARDPRLV